MEEGKGKLELLLDSYAVCRLDKNAPVSDWRTRGLFSSITRTAEELSVVCPDAQVPGAVKKEGGWRILMVEGPLGFSLTGVLASLTAPLSREGISVFALSSYNTDYLLVKKEQLEKAVQTFRGEGYEVEERCRGRGKIGCKDKVTGCRGGKSTTLCFASFYKSIQSSR